MLDTLLVFLTHLNFNGFAAKSDTSSKHDNDWSASGRVFWDSDIFTVGAGHLIKQPNFQTDLGYTPRDDFKKSILDMGYKPRSRWEGFRQLTFRTLLEYYTDNRNIVQTKNNDYSLVAEFESSDMVRVVYTDHVNRVQEPFRIGEISIGSGDYGGGRFDVEYTGASSRRITGDPLVEYLRDWRFWGGQRDVLRLTPIFRISDKASFRPGYEIDKILIDQHHVTIHVLNSRLDYSFSNKWLTSFIAQHNSLDRFTGFNIRLNYIYRLGDNFFIIYNRLDDRLNGYDQDSLILKFTHSFDF